MSAETSPNLTPTPGERFGVEESLEAGEAVLRLWGELDHDSAPMLRAALGRCAEAGAALVLVECSQLAFCDSTGLNVLLEARTTAQERGARIELVALPGKVARVFEITGAISLFPQHASVAAARTARP
ncbi:anti-anti-sigma factor [Streptacidiphilus sp. MAP12-20]|uniref:STAS domain-containing protein n=1 Tax=Streptacidiphilus sp. MAP12-20 TaxID=3156299 RepID=UPI0035124E48